MDERLKRRLFAYWNETNWNGRKIRLLGIEADGIRGLKKLKIEFKFPVVAICGLNGTGKTTILHLAGCAFHYGNKKNGKEELPEHPFAGLVGDLGINKKGAYYTFGDFFKYRQRQNVEQEPLDRRPESLRVVYLYSPDPDFKGRVRKDLKIEKEKEGSWKKWKWMHDYSRRPFKPVVYIPPYRYHGVEAKQLNMEGLSEAEQASIIRYAREILELQNFSKIAFYRGQYGRKQMGMRYVEVQTEQGEHHGYTSFHMGTGEDFVLFFLYLLFKMPDQSLVLVDEIEASLHPRAQRKLVKYILEIVSEKGHQIIMTTHSPYVLESLPPEARILLEHEADGTTKAFIEVNPNYALYTLDHPQVELEIFVEDEITKAFLTYIMKPEHRRRTNVISVGSADTIFNYKASLLFKRELASGNAGRRLPSQTLIVLDGDKEEEYKNEIPKDLRSENNLHDPWRQWAKEHIIFLLPGSGYSPENWILHKLLNNQNLLKEILHLLNASDLFNEVQEKLRQFQQEGNPKEIFKIFLELIGLNDKNDIVKIIIPTLVKHSYDEFQNVLDKIERLLPAPGKPLIANPEEGPKQRTLSSED